MLTDVFLLFLSLLLFIVAVVVVVVVVVGLLLLVNVINAGLYGASMNSRDICFGFMHTRCSE